MKRTYFCPHCGGDLNPNVKIILRAEIGGQKGLFLFSPQPGNYRVILPNDVTLRPGDEVDFFCPACGVNLRSAVNTHLAELGFRLEDGTRGHLHFSRKYGERATYFVTNEKVRSYGDHAETYGDANFFGAGATEE